MLELVLPKSNISPRGNLHWLYILRNLMILGESLLIFIASYFLDINLPQEQLYLIIFSIFAVNLYTWMRLQTDEPVTELEIFSQISIDVLAMAALIYLTGGASNPIIWVFLLPLIITAIMLPQSYAWNMVILTCCTYTVLIRFYIPLPDIEPHIVSAPMLSEHSAIHDPTTNPDLKHYLHNMRDRNYYNLHIFGMWFGFVFSSGLVAFFVVELSKSIKEQERRLADARENALRNDRVVSMGTLAASAAHDMGTPLGTMAIISHEMELEYPETEHPDLHSKIKIMNQQIDRCKSALSVLSASAGEMRAESGEAMPLITYIDGVFNQWRTHDSSTKLNLKINPSFDINAQILADRTFTHAIINILNNAAKVTQKDKGIEFNADWDDDRLKLNIRDYGPGFPEEVLKRVGSEPIPGSKQGLGVGLFLTSTTVHRLGGEIIFSNLDTGGANVYIQIPLIKSKALQDD